MAQAHVHTDAELRRLTAQVMAADASEPFGAYLFRTDEFGAEVARALETIVFCEGFGDTPEAMVEEYATYKSSSFFFCIIDHLRKLPAGVMRVTVPSPYGFKTLNDIETVWGESAAAVMERTGRGIDLTRTWDITTLGIAEEYRGKAAKGLVSMGLYQSLTLAAISCGVEWFLAIFDMPYFRLLRWKLRLIFAGFDGLAPAAYMGAAAAIPAWCSVAEAERRLAEQAPDLYAILVLGEGLEPALRRVDLAGLDDLAVRRSGEAAG